MNIDDGAALILAVCITPVPFPKALPRAGTRDAAILVRLYLFHGPHFRKAAPFVKPASRAHICLQLSSKEKTISTYTNLQRN